MPGNTREGSGPACPALQAGQRSSQDARPLAIVISSQYASTSHARLAQLRLAALQSLPSLISAERRRPNTCPRRQVNHHEPWWHHERCVLWKHAAPTTLTLAGTAIVCADWLVVISSTVDATSYLTAPAATDTRTRRPVSTIGVRHLLHRLDRRSGARHLDLAGPAAQPQS